MAEPLTPGQQRFAGTFARETGLDPRVVGAWLKAEQSGSAAQYYEGKGYHNWLNIANTDTGPAGGAHSSEWRDPERAAKASAEWIKGKGRIASEYGHPASGITGILRTAGRSPEEQIRAIAGSGWASSGYEGGNTLRTLYHELSGHQLALMSAAQRRAGAVAGIAPVIPEQATAAPVAAPTPNPIDAIRAVHTMGLKPEPGSNAEKIEKNWDVVKALFDPTSPIGSPPVAGATHETHLYPLPETMHNGPTKLGGFLPHDAPLTRGRFDQGVDGSTKPGGPLIAPAAFEVVGVKTNPGGFGENYPIIRITDRNSPLYGREIYAGHTHSTLPVGAKGPAGMIFARTGHGTEREGNARTPGWFEIGFWPPGNMEAGRTMAPYLR